MCIGGDAARGIVILPVHNRRASSTSTVAIQMPHKPRILLYCVLSRFGGVETHIKNFAKVLSENGAEVTVAAKWALSPDGSRDFYRRHFQQVGVQLITPRLNVLIQECPFIPGALKSVAINLVAEIYFRLELRAASYDVVSINASGTFGLRLRRYSKRKGRVIYHEHQTFVGANNSSEKRLHGLRKMDLVCVNSSRDAASASTLLGSERRIAILPAISAPMDKRQPSARPSGSPFRVAFVGNVAAREKGAHKLLNIWRSRAVQGMQLTLYGPNPDQTGAVKEMENVRFAGPFQASELGQVFGSIDLLVHPADDESLGLVLIEAMAHGVPFVATHVGGIIDIASDNPHVLTVENDEAVIYKAILHMRQQIEDGLHDPVALQKLYRLRWSNQALAARWLHEYQVESATA